MSVPPVAVPVSSPASLDALVGAHITHETPDVYWEDVHGLFKFESEQEAWMALGEQLFLPNVDWSRTAVRQVERYRRYCAEGAAIWAVVGVAVVAFGPLQISWQQGQWQCAFGGHPAVVARFPGVAICLAALQAYGLSIDADLDRIDAELNRAGVPAMMDMGAGQSSLERDEPAVGIRSE